MPAPGVCATEVFASQDFKDLRGLKADFEEVLQDWKHMKEEDRLEKSGQRPAQAQQTL